MKKTGCKCLCGGEMVTDEVTVEAGGHSITQGVGEEHCDKCGRTLEEVAADAEGKTQIAYRLMGLRDAGSEQ